MKLLKYGTLIFFGFIISAGAEELQPARLFAKLPEYCPIPDALALAPDGSVVDEEDYADP